MLVSSWGRCLSGAGVPVSMVSVVVSSVDSRHMLVLRPQTFGVHDTQEIRRNRCNSAPISKRQRKGFRKHRDCNVLAALESHWQVDELCAVSESVSR
jgi:hypothetical protein